MLSDAINGHDARMPQCRGRLRFVVKPPYGERAGKPSVRQHFERDRAPRGKLLGSVNDAHSSAADHFQELVLAKWEGQGMTIARPGVRDAAGQRLHRIGIRKIRA